MTTFGGKTLHEHTREKGQASYHNKLASDHIPIYPSPAHDPHKFTLQACGGSDKIARNSYVIIQPLVRVKFSVLVEYGKIMGDTWAKRLDTRSHHLLVRHTRFIEPAAGMQIIQTPPRAASPAGTSGNRWEEEALTPGPRVVKDPPARAVVVEAESRAAPSRQSFELRVESGSSSNLPDTSQPQQLDARQPEVPHHRSGPIHSDRLLISTAAGQAPLNFGHHHHYGSITPQGSERIPTISRPAWVTVDIPYSPTAPLVAARRSAPSVQVERYPTTSLLPTYSHPPADRRSDVLWKVILAALLVAVVLLTGHIVFFNPQAKAVMT